jgi:hypothetical protein
VSDIEDAKRPALHQTGANSDKLRLTVEMADRLSIRPGPCDYPGGMSKFISDFLLAWGVPVGPNHVKNIISKGRHTPNVTN